MPAPLTLAALLFGLLGLVLILSGLMSLLRWRPLAASATEPNASTLSASVIIETVNLVGLSPSVRKRSTTSQPIPTHHRSNRGGLPPRKNTLTRTAPAADVP